MLSGFDAFPGGPRALRAYHSVKEAWRAQKVCANAWWLTGWLQRGRHESAGQTVGSRWFSEEEQEAIPDLCPRKKKKLSIRCIKQSSVEARWDYRWWSHSSIHALPDTVISSGAVCRASPCVTGSTHGSPRGSSYLHIFKCAWSQFRFTVLFVPLLMHWVSDNFSSKKKKVYLLPKRKYGSLLLML